MELLSNSKAIADIAERLTRSRKCFYNEWPLEKVMIDREMSNEIFLVQNSRNEQIYISLHYHGEKNIRPNNCPCILTLHGYGSNRLQSSAMLAQLPSDYVVCAMDFSGSGKSDGNRVSFGLKEQHDIHYTLQHLRSIGFKQFILWGRSMGATSALLYCTHYQPKDVFLQILDSPFYSFQNVANEIACKSIAIPSLFIGVLVDSLKIYCQKFMFNPFDVNLCDVGECKVPALFVYSRTDDIVQPTNSEQIIGLYKGSYERLVISENHNTVREEGTLSKIYSFITKYEIQEKRSMKSISFLGGNRREVSKSKFIETTLKRKGAGNLYTHKRGLTLTKNEGKVEKNESVTSLNPQRTTSQYESYEEPKARTMKKLSLAKSTVGAFKHKAIILESNSQSNVYMKRVPTSGLLQTPVKQNIFQ